MPQVKTEYQKYLKTSNKHGGFDTHEVNKTFLCDMAKANACQKRAQWYGYETIGPRLYALYKCAIHGLLKSRI